MERFRKFDLDIKNLDPVIVVHYLLTTLLPNPFVNNLCKKPTSNLDELHYRVDRYMQMKEPNEYNRKIRSEVSNQMKDMNKDVHKTKEKTSETRGPRYDYYTLLNTVRTKVFE